MRPSALASQYVAAPRPLRTCSPAAGASSTPRLALSETQRSGAACGACAPRSSSGRLAAPGSSPGSRRCSSRDLQAPFRVPRAISEGPLGLLVIKAAEAQSVSAGTLTHSKGYPRELSCVANARNKRACPAQVQLEVALAIASTL